MLQHQFKTHSKYLLKCAFSPDSQHLVTTSADQTAKLWNVQNWEVEQVSETSCNNATLLSQQLSPGLCSNPDMRFFALCPSSTDLKEACPLGMGCGLLGRLFLLSNSMF